MKNPANFGEHSGVIEATQSELFERPLFSPTWPTHATRAARALERLLAG